MNGGEDIGAAGLAACTACAVQLGADPLVAPLIAGLLAVLVRRAVIALAQHGPALAKTLVDAIGRRLHGR